MKRNDPKVDPDKTNGNTRRPCRKVAGLGSLVSLGGSVRGAVLSTACCQVWTARAWASKSDPQGQRHIGNTEHNIKFDRSKGIEFSSSIACGSISSFVALG